MTAPAQLSNRTAACDPRLGPADAGSLCEATLTRSLPAPPAPLLPIAPPLRRHVAPLARRQLQVPLRGGLQRARTRAPRLSRAVRLAAAATVTLAVVGGVGWIGQAADPGVPAETAMTRVGAGETVWDVAHRVAPKSDQRAVVERIRQLNGMASSAVQPGQQLQVPDHH